MARTDKGKTLEVSRAPDFRAFGGMQKSHLSGLEFRA